MSEERSEPDRYLVAVTRNAPAILAVAAVLAAVVFLVSRSMPERYDATVTVAAQGIGEDASGDVESVRRRLATAASLVSAPAVVTATARRAGLPPDEVEDALSANVDPTANIIEITAGAATPEAAERVADTAAEVFLATRKAGIQDSLARAQAEVRGEIERREAAGGDGGVGELQARLVDLQVRSAVAGEDLRVVRRAELPMAPASPRPVLNAFVAFVAAVILLALAAVARDAVRRRVTSVRELERLAGAPVVAALRTERGEHGRVSVTAREDGTARLALEAWIGDGRLIVVTSAASRPDAGAAVARLGRAFAQAGEDVLVVDADLRRPSLHHRFRVPLDAGVTRLLERLVQSRDVTAPALRRASRTVARGGAGKGRLEVLVAGEPVADAGRLLTVEALEGFARALRATDAERVLVYAPPIPQAAESWILARAADALLLVVPAEHTRAEEAAELADIVAELDVPVALLAMQETRRARAAVRVRTRPALPVRPGLRLARPAEPVKDAERSR